jgi:hypothetical protein
MDLADRIITPLDLKEDIERAEKTGDIRMFILYANLYNEYFVNSLHQNHFNVKKYSTCDKCNRMLLPKFKQQVEDLCSLGVIPKEHGHDNIINLIFDLRNELAHNLKADIKELEMRFEESHKPKTEDSTGVIGVFLKQANPWEKIKMSVFATVTNLYHMHEILNSRKPAHTIHYEINPELQQVSIVIKDYTN